MTAPGAAIETSPRWLAGADNGNKPLFIIPEVTGAVGLKWLLRSLPTSAPTSAT